MTKVISLILVRFGAGPQDVVAIVFEDSPTSKSVSLQGHLGGHELLEFLWQLGKTRKETDEILEHMKSIPSGYRLQLSEEQTRPGGEAAFTEAVLLASASEKKTIELVKICRQMRDVWEEQPRSTGGGSFRYITGGRLVYGINVGGNLRIPQLGNWIYGCERIN